MKSSGFNRYMSYCGTMGMAAGMLAGIIGCAVTQARAQTKGSTVVDVSLGAERFPEDDAIILRWQQDWTLDEDGTVHERDHKWVKLLNSRPIRRYADPRIPFLSGQDELIIHKAQTILADGTILPVPDYSFNVAGPDDVAGWPEYAGWQDMIVSFSGIEADVVLELDYEIVTPPGLLPWVWADIRLDDEYPIVEREISVTVPQSTRLTHQIDRMGNDPSTPPTSGPNGARVYKWTFANLPGSPDEPHSLPWERRCGRLRFTTCPSADDWVSTIIQRVDLAAKADSKITKFAEEAVKDEADPTERVRKIAEKLHDSFNIIDSPKTLRLLQCRNAAEVLQSNYGNALEAAAVWAAALRSVDVDVSLNVGVDATTWDQKVPTTASFAGVVVAAHLPNEPPLHIHPQAGLFKDPGHWGRHLLLKRDDSGALQKTYVYARGEKKPSDLNITGKIAVDTEGKATGELRLRLTGAFYDPDRLDSADAQTSLVNGMIGRVLTGFEVPTHSVVTLSDAQFKATANVASDGALKSYAKQHVLKLGEGPAFLADVGLPLGQSSRLTTVYVDSRLREQVDLTIEIPEKWSVAIAPAQLGTVNGSWGSVSQTVEVEGQTVRFHRAITINTETISPEDFNSLREAINTLRADRSLLLTCAG